MNSYVQSGPSSAVASISDLDGYTIQNCNSYMPDDQDDFGFDPPAARPLHPKIEQVYSPPEDTASPLGDWPGFERPEDRLQKQAYSQVYQLDKLITQNLPNSATAISRYGQVTPPRTNSAGSLDQEKGNDDPSAKNSSRRKSKQTKDANQPATTASGRKRKTTRKVTANVESPSEPEDSKRKASLEKNRLAAAKCRVNKKEKTEQLQRDSHDKAVHNAYLKDQVMRMKEEVQQLNALLLTHASCEGCKSPEEIQKHLQELSAEFLPQHTSIGGFPDYAEMSLDGLPSVTQGEDYFAMHSSGQGLLNPPLPEFNRSADFDVHTPMQID